MIRRQFFGSAAVAVCLALGPVLAEAAAPSPTLDRIKEARAITLGYRNDAAPFSFKDREGRVLGYSVELCARVATAVQKDLGLARDARAVDAARGRRPHRRGRLGSRRHRVRHDDGDAHPDEGRRFQPAHLRRRRQRPRPREVQAEAPRRPLRQEDRRHRRDDDRGGDRPGAERAVRHGDPGPGQGRRRGHARSSPAAASTPTRPTGSSSPACGSARRSRPISTSSPATSRSSPMRW